MVTTETTLAQLRRRGYRLTPQRLAVLQALEDSRCHLSPGEVYQLAAQRLPRLTEATVYRTLDFLVGQGLALVAHVGSGRMVYESAAHDHDHLICRVCGRSVEIDHSQLLAQLKPFEEATGYRIDASHVTFFGLCPACRAAQVGGVASAASRVAPQPPAPSPTSRGA
jgi:Fe2+ or Zn2+ uptake regulation protein